MKAQEANKIASKEKVNEQYQEIIKLIKKASNRGWFNVWYAKYNISDDVKKILIKDGYEIKEVTWFKGENQTEIRW